MLAVKNLATAAALSVLAAACAPDVAQNPPPGATIVVLFDPGAAVPVVPSPNDLARDPRTGLVVVPPTPGETVAQREFEVDYLGALAGFPFESTAQVAVSGDLDAGTVRADDVIAFDLGSGGRGAMAPAAVEPTYLASTRSILVTPISGAWTRGHTYAIALLAGTKGLRGAKGESVIGSDVWALVSSSTPLVTCQDLASSACQPTVDIIPSTETDPEKRLRDQTAKAVQLEQIRRMYAPLLDGLAASGTPRENVPIVWTFTIVDAGEVTFDPAHGVVPFPNDVLRAGGKVSMPNPRTLQPLSAADCAAPTDPAIALTCGLNTLDGFSTLAAPVSESSDTLGAVAQASIDPASLGASSVGMIAVASRSPRWQATAPAFQPCIGCRSSPGADGKPQASPQQLQWSLTAPLDEQTTYVAYVTSAVHDTEGKPVVASPAFAMLRLVNPLYEGGHSTVSLLDDAQAKRLEPLRLAMKPLLDGLASAGVARNEVVLAFAFTTQSEGVALDQLHAYPSTAQLGLPDVPLYAANATAKYQQLARLGGIPFGAIGNVYVGAYLTALAVTGSNGTLDPEQPRIAPVPFVLFLPAAAAPSSGFPVTIFGHDVTRWRNDAIALANSLAMAGQATIATDVLLHGDRSSCTGSAAATGHSTDDASCAAPATQRCNEDPVFGRCIARSDASRAACGPAPGDPTGNLACTALGQGACVPADGKCEGGDLLRDSSGRPIISGWNLLSVTNLFGTRDAFRQQVIDLSQLERVLQSRSTGSLSALAGATFDSARFGYAGQGLGGMLGTLFTAASPQEHNVVLDAAGGALVRLLLGSPAFAAQRTALLGSLAQLGADPGTPAFDRLTGIAQWILDPADPANLAYRAVHLEAASRRRVFVQFIQGDQVVPEDASIALTVAASRSFSGSPPSYGCTGTVACYEFTEAGDGFDAGSAVPSTRHGFLLQPPQGSRGLVLTQKAQIQAAAFLANGQVAP